MTELSVSSAFSFILIIFMKNTGIYLYSLVQELKICYLLLYLKLHLYTPTWIFTTTFIIFIIFRNLLSTYFYLEIVEKRIYCSCWIWIFTKYLLHQFNFSFMYRCFYIGFRDCFYVCWYSLFIRVYSRVDLLLSINDVKTETQLPSSGR